MGSTRCLLTIGLICFLLAATGCVEIGDDASSPDCTGPATELENESNANSRPGENWLTPDTVRVNVNNTAGVSFQVSIYAMGDGRELMTEKTYSQCGDVSLGQHFDPGRSYEVEIHVAGTKAYHDTILSYEEHYLKILPNGTVETEAIAIR